MNKIRKNVVFKIACFILIITFLTLDISRAYPLRNTSSQCNLAIQSSFQVKMLTNLGIKFKDSVFFQSNVLNTILLTGDFLLEELKHSDRIKKLKYLDVVLGREMQMRHIPYWEVTDLSKIHFVDGDPRIVVIPYVPDKDYVIKIALKKEISPDEIVGFEWDVSQKYLIKYLNIAQTTPTDLKQTKRPIKLRKTILKPPVLTEHLAKEKTYDSLGNNTEINTLIDISSDKKGTLRVTDNKLRHLIEEHILGCDIIAYQKADNLAEAKKRAIEFLNAIRTKIETENIFFESESELISFLNKNFSVRKIISASGKGTRFSPEGIIEKTLYKPDGVNTQIKLSRTVAAFGMLEDVIIVDPSILYHLMRYDIPIDDATKRVLLNNIDLVLQDLATKNILPQNLADNIWSHVDVFVNNNLEAIRTPSGQRDLSELVFSALRHIKTISDDTALNQFVSDKIAYATFSPLIDRANLINETFKDNLLGQNCILVLDSLEGIGKGYIKALEKLEQLGKGNEARYSIVIYGDSLGWSLDKYPNAFFMAYLQNFSLSHGSSPDFPVATIGVKSPKDGRAEGRARIKIKMLKNKTPIPISLKEWNAMTRAERDESISMAKSRDPHWYTNAQIFVFDSEWVLNHKKVFLENYAHNLKTLPGKKKLSEFWVSDFLNIAADEYLEASSITRSSPVKTRLLLLGEKAPVAPKTRSRMISFQHEHRNMILRKLKDLGVEVEKGTTIGITLTEIDPGFDWNKILFDIFGDNMEEIPALGNTKLKGVVNLTDKTQIGKGSVLDGRATPLILSSEKIARGVFISGQDRAEQTFVEISLPKKRVFPLNMDFSYEYAKDKKLVKIDSRGLLRLGIFFDHTTNLKLLVSEETELSTQEVLLSIFGNIIQKKKETDQIYLLGDLFIDETCRIENGTQLDGRFGNVTLLGDTNVSKGVNLSNVRAVNSFFHGTRYFSQYTFKQPDIFARAQISDSVFFHAEIEYGSRISGSTVSHTYVSSGAILTDSDTLKEIILDDDILTNRTLKEKNMSLLAALHTIGDPVQGVYRLGEVTDSDISDIKKYQKESVHKFYEKFVENATILEMLLYELDLFFDSSLINGFTIQQIKSYVVSKLRTHSESFYSQPSLEYISKNIRAFLSTEMNRIHDVDITNRSDAHDLFREIVLLIARLNIVDVSIDPSKLKISSLIRACQGGKDSFFSFIETSTEDKFAIDATDSLFEMIYALDAKTFLFLPDNIGEVEGDALLWTLLIRLGHEVIIAPKDCPNLGDVDMIGVNKVISAHPFLVQAMKDERIRVIPSGSRCEGVFTDRLSPKLREVLEKKDISAIISKGQANLFTFAVRNKLKIPFASIFLSKSYSSWRITGIRGDTPFQPVFAIIPPKTAAMTCGADGTFISRFAQFGKINPNLDIEDQNNVDSPESLIDLINSLSLDTNSAEKLFIETWDPAWGHLIEQDRPKRFRAYFIAPDTTVRFVIDSAGKINLVKMPVTKYSLKNPQSPVNVASYKTDNMYMQDVYIDIESSNVQFKFGIIRLEDASIETVGVLRPGQDSICVSCATGCMNTPGCKFCATGEKTQRGEIRSVGLTKEELRDQVELVISFIRNNIFSEFGTQDIQLSFMGMGEPLVYPEMVLNVIRELEQEKHITKTRISTTASLAMLQRFKFKAHDILPRDIRPPMFQFSLQSSEDKTRRSLVRKPQMLASFGDMIRWVIQYNRDLGILDRVDIRVTLMKGVNDSEEEAAKMARRIFDICLEQGYSGEFHIKATPLNEVAHGYQAPDEQKLDEFVNAINSLSLSNIRAFRTGGSPGDRAKVGRVTCGTLVGKKQDSVKEKDSGQILAEGGLLPPSMDFITTLKCTEECKICFADNMPLHQDVGLEKQKKMINTIYENGVRRLIFTGGEPLLVKHLKELLKYAHSKGMTTALYTTGRLLSPDKAKEIMPYINMISFPLDGFDEQSNIYSGKPTGRFADTLRCLRMMRTDYPDKEVQALTIVTNRNRKVLEEVGLLLTKETQGLNSFHWKLSYYDRRGRSVKTFEAALEDPYYLAYDVYVEVVSPVEEKFTFLHARHSPRARDKAYLFMYPDGTITTTIDNDYYEMGNVLDVSTLSAPDNVAIFKEITAQIVSRAIPIKKSAKAVKENLPPTTIVLVNIPSPKYPGCNRALGIEALKGHLTTTFGSSVNVYLIDMQVDANIQELVNTIARARPDILGFSLGAGGNCVMDAFLNIFDSTVPKENHPFMLVGNMVATFSPERILDEFGINRDMVAVAIGEGELAIEGIVRHLREGKNLEEVPNIMYIKDGYATYTYSALINTKRISIPAMDTVKKLKNTNALYWIEASRGCNHNCTFCSRRTFRNGKGWMPIPLKNVHNQIKSAIRAGIHKFAFCDDTLTANTKIEHKYGLRRVEEIAKIILSVREEFGVEIEWEAETRSDNIFDRNDTPEERTERERIWAVARKSGLASLFLGLESGSDTQLERYNKKLNSADNEGALSVMREIGISTGMMGFIVIDPLVSLNELYENILFMDRNKIVDSVTNAISVMRAQIGSPYMELLDSKGLLLNLRDNMIFYNYKCESPEVQIIAETCTQWIDEVYKIFFFLKKYARDGSFKKSRKLYSKYSAEFKKQDYELLKELVFGLKNYRNTSVDVTVSVVLRKMRVKRTDLMRNLLEELDSSGLGAESEFLKNKILEYLDYVKKTQSLDNATVSNKNPDTTHGFYKNQLAQIGESYYNNLRVETIVKGNSLIGKINKISGKEVLERINEDDITAIISDKLTKAFDLTFGKINEPDSSVKDSPIDILKDFDQIEADGIASSAIALDRSSKRTGSKIIFALETSWLPEGDAGRFQNNMLTLMLQKLRTLSTSLGLENFEIIIGEGTTFINDVFGKINTNKNYSNIIFVGEQNLIKSTLSKSIETLDKKKRPFISGIDPSIIVNGYAKYGDNQDYQIDVEIVSIISITFDLVMGKNPGKTAILSKYYPESRYALFLPGAKIMKYSDLMDKYDKKLKSLIAT